MNEVSCRVFEIFLQEMKKRAVDPSTVCRGTGVDPTTLADKNARIDWSVFRLVMANLGKVFTRDELANIGKAHITSPLLLPISLTAQLLFNTREIYQFWTQPNGPGHQLFACMDSRCVVIDETHLVVEIMIQAGYEPCDEFYYTTIGGLASVPTILGLPFAEVTMERTAFGARYHVVLPPGGGRLASVRRAVTWPFTVRRAGRELRDANEGLIRQYREIAAAQAALALHARQLSVAHRISEVMHRAVDVERTLETIAASLDDVAGFAFVTVACDVAHGDEVRTLRATAGALEAGPADVAMDFEWDGSVERARLELWIPRGAPAGEYEELAEILRPTIAIALENARSMSALTDSRRQLHQQVQELTVAYGMVEQASIVKSQFVTNVSHELRTPMNGVLGMTTLLRDTPLNKDQASYLAALEQSGESLMRIIDDVLDFSRLEAGGVQLESAALDLGAVTEEALTAAAAPGRDKGLSFVIDVDRALPPQLRGDARRLGQLLAHLFSNAVKFTAVGGVVVRVALLKREGGRARVRLEVADTGVGIAIERLPTLFQPFVQGDGSLSRRFGGAGLGLSIARQLAEMMGTTIEVESTLGKGSRFWCDVSLEEIGGRAEAPRQPPTEGIRVLLLDGADATRAATERALAAAGMEVKSATVGEFLAGAERAWARFDAVVLREDDVPDAAQRVLVEGGPRPARVVLVRDRQTPADASLPTPGSVVPWPLRTDRLVDAVVSVWRRASAAPATPSTAVTERAIVREPEALTERILIQLLGKRGVRATAVPSIAELARLSAAEPEALVFTSLRANTNDEQRELEQLLHRLDLEPGARRVVAMVSDSSEVPRGHSQRFLTVATKPMRMALIEDVLALWRRSEPTSS